MSLHEKGQGGTGRRQPSLCSALGPTRRSQGETMGSVVPVLQMQKVGFHRPVTEPRPLRLCLGAPAPGLGADGLILSRPGTVTRLEPVRGHFYVGSACRVPYEEWLTGKGP